MQVEIQRQYDDIIASHYDFDPQAVIGDSLCRAIGQIERHLEGEAETPGKVLDLGVGTGRFLEMCRQRAPDIQPFGLDISRKMIDIACRRIPDLSTAVDDAARLDRHFPEVVFDLIATHFITGFVPMAVLAPKIFLRLNRGGLWSFVGGTRAGFPILQQKARSRVLRWLFGVKAFDVQEFVCNPADEREVRTNLDRHGFQVIEAVTLSPSVRFQDFREFLEFAYYGGWLTPFVESIGLHKAPLLLRAILNGLVFPVEDHHHIVVALARKP
jgi:SAM-dependent methyltransferase